MQIQLPALIRPLAAGDTGYLERALANSVHTESGIIDFDVMRDPILRRAVEGWGRPGDMGVVAELGQGSHARLVGAAWLRLYSEAEPLYGYVDERTPALVISLEPALRGFGIGSEMLRALLEAAREAGGERVSLSVDPGNRAKRLYERFGFREIDAPRLIENDANPVLVVEL
jgi:ribosomal protein S18 acetylase RimI-like enzyme